MFKDNSNVRHISIYPRLTRALVAGGDRAQAGQLHLLRVAARAARGAARHRLPHRRGELLLGGVQGAQVQGRLPHSVQVYRATGV